jgi:RNA polymerase sigma-70 factor (ECF subfamily)
MEIPTDEALIADARAGKREAVEALLERHEPRVYRFALRMCGSEDAAREVLQETLIAAFRHLHDFRGDARLSTWLFQVARSFCTKARRRRSGEPAAMEAIDAPEAAVMAMPDAEGPHARAHASEVGEVLRAALSTLPDHYREVLLLKDVEGLSAEEVAAVLGEKVPAVKSRLHRARLELRRMLEGVLGEPEPDEAPCPELAEELAGYAAGEIDQGACARMEAHMVHCRRCAEACERLKSTVMLCSRVEGDAVPRPIQAAIRQALLAGG